MLLQIRIPHSGGGPPCRLRIDKLPDGRYRATAASLFEAHDLELCRTSDLEQVLRHAYCLGVCRSFREVLAAMQQLSELDDADVAADGEVGPPHRRPLEFTTARRAVPWSARCPGDGR